MTNLIDFLYLQSNVLSGTCYFYYEVSSFISNDTFDLHRITATFLGLVYKTEDLINCRKSDRRNFTSRMVESFQYNNTTLEFKSDTRFLECCSYRELDTRVFTYFAFHVHRHFATLLEFSLWINNFDVGLQ
jgi:hypothetical protein